MLYCYSFEQKQVSCCEKSQYREKFYCDLEKLYKKLYSRVKQRASEDVWMHLEDWGWSWIKKCYF